MLAVERSYRHVKITVKETRYEDGAVYSIADHTIYRDNDNIKQLVRYTETQNPNVAPGTVFVHGWTNMYTYDLRRVSDTDEYEILSYNLLHGFGTAAEAQNTPLFAAFCLFEFTLSDYLSSPRTTILSVESEVVGGRDVFSIYTQFVTPGSPDKTVRYRLYFDRNSFLFLGLTGYWSPKDADALYFERRLVYQEAPNASKLKSVIQWSASPKDPSAKNVQFEDDFRSVLYGPIAATEFSLASLGVEEPSSDASRESSVSSMSPSSSGADETDEGSSTWFFILLVALVFGVFGIVFAVMASKRRKGTG